MIIFCILKEKFLTLYAIHNQMDNNNSYGWEHILLNSIWIIHIFSISFLGLDKQQNNVRYCW